MAEVFQSFSNIFLEAYNAIIETIPVGYQNFIRFFIIALGIIIYSLIIWKFYQSISKKNLWGLNLSKYNTSKHPVMYKLFAGALYFVEYLLIMPFLIFLWFTLFTILLILITESLEISALLIISATTIAAIRMLAYHHEDLAKDVAKLIPFTILATSLLNPNFFSIERIATQITQISGVFSQILIYLFFIVLLEFVLRALDFFISLFQLGEVKIETEEEITAEEEEKVKKELAKSSKKK